jgi:hypothetical protein
MADCGLHAGLRPQQPPRAGARFTWTPSIGVGDERPLDYSVEIGYKIVGF